MIKIMADASFELWNLKNSCRHGYNSSTKKEMDYEQIKRELKELYLLRTEVQEEEKSIFKKTLTSHMKEMTKQIKNWITHNKKLILQSVRNQKKEKLLHKQQRQKNKHVENTSKNGNKKTKKKKEKRKTSLQTEENNKRKNNKTKKTNINKKTLNLPTINEQHTLRPIQMQLRSRKNTTEFKSNGFPDHPS